MCDCDPMCPTKALIDHSYTITSIKNNCIKLKVEVGMEVPKECVNKGIRYMLHPYIFSSNGISILGSV